ncbi:MAG: hypothetical protein JW929_03900 [Anaerolineales bacterium]|nr:hypothetical protein [Anaerolineales bacterium]
MSEPLGFPFSGMEAIHTEAGNRQGALAAIGRRDPDLAERGARFARDG